MAAKKWLRFRIPVLHGGDATSESPGGAAEARVGEELAAGIGRFRVIKPHGSLNWLVPQDSPRAVEPAEMLLPLTSDLKIRYWPASRTFNYARRPGDLPRDVKILIVPPSPEKPEVVRQAISDEFEAFKSADEVFVLGYSLPRTDQDQRDLIMRAVKERTTRIRMLTIVNFNAPMEYFDDVRELLEPREVQIFNDGFIDSSSSLR